MKKIWISGFESQKNYSVVFSYAFKLKNKKGLSLKISANTLYQVYVNSKLHFFGNNFENALYFDEFSLEKIKTPETVLSILVTTNNKTSPYIAIELTKQGQKIATAEDFAAYYEADRITSVAYDKNFYLEDYVIDDKRKTLFGITPKYQVCEKIVLGDKEVFPKRLIPDFSITQKTPVCIEYGATKPALEGKSFTDCENDIAQEVSRFVFTKDAVSKFSKDIKDGYQLYDFGKSMIGFFKLSVSVVKSSDLYIVFDNVLNYDSQTTPASEKPLNFFREGNQNVLKLRFESGNHEFTSFNPYNFRYAKIIAYDGECTLKSFSALELSQQNYDNTEFITKDKELFEIFVAAKNTFSNNLLFSNFFPETHFLARAENVLCGNNIFEYNFFNNILNSGGFDYQNTKPSYAMLFVVELCEHLTRTGNRIFIEKFRHIVKSILSHFEKYLNDDFLLENLYDDYLNANSANAEINFSLNILYCHMLHCASILLASSDVQNLCNKVANSIFLNSYNGELFCDSATKQNGKYILSTQNSEITQYYSFYFRVAKCSTYPKLAAKLTQRDIEFAHTSDSVFAKVLRLNFLLKNGENSLAIKEIKEYFSNMARTSKSIWEFQNDDGNKNFAIGSYVVCLIVSATTSLFFIDRNNRRIGLLNRGYSKKSIYSCKNELGNFKIYSKKDKIIVTRAKNFKTYRID